MKQITIFLNAIFFTLSMNLYSQPVIDGSFDGTPVWGTAVATADGTTGWSGISCDKLYVTFDNTYAYFSASFLSNPSGWERGAFAINSMAGGGSSDPWGVAVSYGYSNNPDFVCVARFNGAWAEKRSWNSGTSSWDGGGTNIQGSDMAWAVDYSYIEGRILLADLGFPSRIDIQFYVSGNNETEHGVFDACPDDVVMTSWNDPTTLSNYQANIPMANISASNGNWSSPGTWVSGVIPASSSNVFIEHTVALDQNFILTNLNIASGASFTINPAFDLTVNGVLTNNGTLTLQSDATGTASLIESTAGVTASVDRYMTADRWNSVAIPVAAATANSFLGMYLIYYDEPTQTWPNVSQPSDPLGVGVGYSAWPIGAAATASYAGVLNTGIVSLPLSFSGDRWNSVGNPYPSAIDWGGSGWTKTEIDAGAYVWNGVQYLSNVGGTGLGSLPGGIIPAQQSFMVRVSAGATAPVLSVSDTARVHGVDPYKGTESMDVIKLKVVGNNYSDETFIALNPASTYDFDGQFDAYKLMGIEEAPQLYTKAGNDNLSINSIPGITKGLSIPLNLHVGEAGIYEITLNDLEGFENTPLYLEDLQEHKVVDLKANSLYKCEASPEDDPMRFLLHFDYSETPVSGELSDNSGLLIVPIDKTILISSNEAITGMVRVYNLLGQEMEATSLNEAISAEVRLDSKPGYYIVRVQSENGITSRKVFVK